jgi:hypothetical protein
VRPHQALPVGEALEPVYDVVLRQRARLLLLLGDAGVPPERVDDCGSVGNVGWVGCINGRVMDREWLNGVRRALRGKLS